jgi:arylsulfatase A-like enzyme
MFSRILAAILFALLVQTAVAKTPNVILVLVDDLGYADLGCYGSKIPTPNLDRMASEGVKLTSFYTAGCVCTPTRSSIMTGCYPRRIEMHKHVLFPADKRGLNPSEVTLAELAKTQKYATAIIGKWHLGDQVEFLPTRQGFDYYFGIPYSNDMGGISQQPGVAPKNKRPPTPLLRNEEVIESEPDQRFLTERYTDETMKFIEQHKSEPFFIYLAHTMPHAPLYVSDQHKGKSGEGLFGDVVMELDTQMGRLMAKLKELKLDDNTVVIFTSDNGGPGRPNSFNTPWRGNKASNWEGGHRVPCIVRWPQQVPANKTVDELGVSFDFYPTLAKLMGAKLPSDRTIDGRDVWPLFNATAGAKTPHEQFYYYTAQGKLNGVRAGNWKLLTLNGQPNNANQPNKGKNKAADDSKPAATDSGLLLFDLASDPGENKNVAEANPAVVTKLQQLLENMRTELGDDKNSANVRPAAYVEMPVPLLKK